jgi:hypothetical protein
VAQGVGSKFKPQYRQKKKEKEKERRKKKEKYPNIQNIIANIRVQVGWCVCFPLL